MKKMFKFLPLILLSLFIFVGCASEEEADYPAFNLTRQAVAEPNSEVPAIYMIDPYEHKDEIQVGYLEGDGFDLDNTYYIYDLENISVTDEEITIEFEGEVHSFERLSESVAVDSNEDRYQFELGLSEMRQQQEAE